MTRRRGKDRLFELILDKARQTEGSLLLILDEAHLLDGDALTEVDGDIENPLEVVLWANPQILSQVDRDRKALRSQRVTEQERKLREQQLKALGYVD